jgi:putative transposase
LKEPTKSGPWPSPTCPWSAVTFTLVAVMDVKSRCILGWSLSNTMETDWVLCTLKQTVRKYGEQEIINSDQGSQFTSDGYVAYIKSLGTTKISMDGKIRAIDNVFIERFWRTLKY